MSNVATIEPRRSVTVDMANRYGMEADAFEMTLRATIFPKAGSREEFAAFLLVAREYNLNPVTREIYAMPKKGGGIIPVVSIDGWVRLANEHGAFDGMTFEAEHDGKNLVSMTCRIYRKDRAHPTEVTEFLNECIRDTEPWKMKHRMLRHKAMIQCARYAFGFAGIYDPDEAEKFAEIQERPQSIHRAPIPVAAIEHHPSATETAEERSAERLNPAPARRAPAPPQALPPQEATSADAFDPDMAIVNFRQALDNSETGTEIEAAWNAHIEPIKDKLFPPDYDEAARLYRLAEGRVEA